MMRLKSKLLSLNADKPRPVKIYSPANGEELLIPFKADKIAKVVGKLAQIAPPLAVRPKAGSEASNHNDDNPEVENQNGANLKNKYNIEQKQQDVEPAKPTLISGVLVQNDFKMSLMAPEDLREYAGLTTTTITCRQRITLAAAGFDLIRWSLEGVFGSVRVIDHTKKSEGGNASKGGAIGYEGVKLEESTKEEDGVEAADEKVDRSMREIIIMDCVAVKWRPAGDVEVVWDGNVMNDGIADAVLAALVMLESSPAAVKCKYIKLNSTVPHHSQTRSFINLSTHNLQHPYAFEICASKANITFKTPQGRPINTTTNISTKKTQRQKTSTPTIFPTSYPSNTHTPPPPTQPNNSRSSACFSKLSLATPSRR